MLKQALAQVQRNPADEKFEEMLSLFLDSYKKPSDKEHSLRWSLRNAGDTIKFRRLSGGRD